MSCVQRTGAAVPNPLYPHACVSKSATAATSATDLRRRYPRSQDENGKSEDFHDFPLVHLADVARAGQAVIDKLNGIEQAQFAMTRLFAKYLDSYEPKRWRELFESADKNAYQVKYMFREQISITKTKFTDHVSKSPSSGRDMYEKLVDAALTEYGEQGLVPQEELARSNFLENPRELLDVVENSIKNTALNSKLWRLRQICKAWMEVCVEQERPAMTPHHTQALIMLIFAKFYECKRSKDTAVIPAKDTGGIKFRHIIGQMSTGEGKSIVIAMLAIFLLQEYEGEITRVHILENNNGLLERDYET